MTIGRFDDGHNEFIVENMYPIRPLINYIWNEEYIMGIDHMGQGKGFASVGEGLRRDLFLPDTDNRLIYVREEDSGRFACVNKPFDKSKLEAYCCRVGVGYQRIVSRFDTISTEFAMTVPEVGKAELWQITVRNTSDQKKRLSVFAYAKIHVNETPHCSYNLCDWNQIVDGLYFSHKIYGAEHPYSGIYLCADVPAASYCTSETRFRGLYQTLEHPVGLQAERLDCHGSSYDEYPAAAMQFTMELAPGEERTIHLAVGVSDSREAAGQEAKRLLSAGFFDTTIHSRRQKLARTADVYRLECGDPYLDRLTNVWLKNQVQLGKTWARVYGKGIRDMLQDITAFVSMDSDLAREKILSCLGYQFANGNTVRMYAPFLRHPYMDGAAWIPETVLTYLKETGDTEILSQEIPFFESNETGTVLEHIRRGIHFLTTNLGSHGLCLWGGGDWNDSINNAGMKGLGESVWLSIAAVKACRQYHEILKIIGGSKEETVILLEAETLRRNVIRYGWEEDHFIYGFTDWGEKVGSDDCAEGKIYLNPQTWAVLADIFDPIACEKLMNTVEHRLHCDYGYVQCAPSYTRLDEHIGRATGFVPGSVENGSVYNHGVAFKIAADCKLGRAEDAYRSLREILPDNPVLAESGVEPYAVTNMYLGPENPYEAKFAPCSWITGTAGWIYRCVTEFIFGIRAEYQGLCVMPCLPQKLDRVKVCRVFRGADYHISISHGGPARMLCDGVEIEGPILPVFEPGTVHRVEVFLGQ